MSCELDAIRPTDLRDLVRNTIERHLSREQLDLMNARGEKCKIGQILDKYSDELHEPAPIAVCHNGGPTKGHWIADYLDRPEPPRTWSSFGSEHADALYLASRINIGGAP